MKIVILTSMFPPSHIGGAEIAAQNVAGSLVAKGHNVSVVTSYSKGLPKHYNENGFSVNRIYYPKIRYLGMAIFWIRCLLIIRRINPDIVHCQTTHMGMPGFIYKKIYKKPYVVWCQGFDVYFPWRFKKIISRMIFGDADAVIGLTEDMKKEMQKNCNKDVFIIPEGISLKKFEGFSKTFFRKKFGIKGSEKVIIFVGSLKPVKGVKYLVDAFKIVIKKNPRAKLFLIGDGPEKQDLKNIIKKNSLEKKVNFIGKIANQKVSEYLTVADIFVLPSLSEGFGIVNLEAMACGLPIIATRVGGVPEIVKDGENGFLVEPKNAEQIAEKILYLLSNDEDIKCISTKNKEKVKDYSWDLIVDKLVKVYFLCLKK
jgi:N-acetyl-alpha-D-glucosaminyl L-malate synthase BshA